MINKIIKIQSFVRGAEMRDKVKLKSRPVNNRNQPTQNPDKSELIYDYTSTQKNEENEIRFHTKYNEIIVNYII